MALNVWWIRRDLRLIDNQALTAALQAGDSVLPVFVIDPFLIRSALIGEKRLAFLFSSLRSLDENLRRLGSRLVIRQGNPTSQLRQLVNEMSADGVYAESDYSPYARQRDTRVASVVPLQLVGFPSVHPAGAVAKQDGQPYTVFTPFCNAWKCLPFPASIIPAPERINTPKPVFSLEIPFLPESLLPTQFPPSEADAQFRLERFTQGDEPGIYRYADERNFMNEDGTSQLSPYLKFGLLSARQAALAAMTALTHAPHPSGYKSAETWLNELIWREFYLNISYHFPFVHKTSFRPEMRKIRWTNNQEEYSAWCSGLTGYPVVDAGMRQLLATGWMHNRARMIVASFLTKDLLIDWRWGERWFMQHLIDGDPASNNGGWQWTAGTGTDAAPYFRIFNPITQGQKFDPDGEFIRHWVPEVIQVPQEYIHTPWAMPERIQQQAGCRIGVDYPAPIVDHAWARQRALEAFAGIKH